MQLLVILFKIKIFRIGFMQVHTGPARRQHQHTDCIRRAQVKVGLINLCKGLFSLNARIYYKLKSGT
jgi:hypothetical protein